MKIKMTGWLLAGAVVVFSVGTGGRLHPKQLQAVTAGQHYGIDTLIPAQADRTPTANLQRIRDIFSPPISDLAISFDVSRQSIYNWIRGETVAEANITKLRDLAKAADMLVEAGMQADASLLRRKFSQNRTLLQLVQAGESATAAMVLLIPILKREAQQRAEMASMFAKRAPSPATADFDLPAPNDDV
jgi:hypothetical protein